MTKAERRKPCGNCPFRKAAPLAHWHPTMYLMLKRNDEHPVGLAPNFGCHKDAHEPLEQQELCTGWLLYQRDNGVPSNTLRMALMNDATGELVAQFKECGPDGPRYDTITELVRVNIEADQEMNPHRYDDDGEYDEQAAAEEVPA